MLCPIHWPTRMGQRKMLILRSTVSDFIFFRGYLIVKRLCVTDMVGEAWDNTGQVKFSVRAGLTIPLCRPESAPTHHGTHFDLSVCHGGAVIVQNHCLGHFRRSGRYLKDGCFIGIFQDIYTLRGRVEKQGYVSGRNTKRCNAIGISILSSPVSVGRERLLRNSGSGLSCVPALKGQTFTPARGCPSMSVIRIVFVRGSDRVTSKASKGCLLGMFFHPNAYLGCTA